MLVKIANDKSNKEVKINCCGFKRLGRLHNITGFLNSIFSLETVNIVKSVFNLLNIPFESI